jgi:hypothetical protein
MNSSTVADLDDQDIRIHAALLLDYGLLARGANNLLYRVCLSGKKVVAKIGINPFFRQLAREQAIAPFTGGAGPAVYDYFVDDNCGAEVLLLELIPGTHLSTFDDDQLLNMGATIARYHRVTPLPETIPVETCHDFCVNRILLMEPKRATVRYRSRFRALCRQATRCMESVPFSSGDHPSVIVHGDLIPLNIILDPTGVFRIIDWEGVRYDAPEADLATFITALHLDERQTGLLLRGYGLPVSAAMLHFRLALHYLQVIAWRLAVQQPACSPQSWNSVAAELDEELRTAQTILQTLPPALQGHGE